MRMERAAATLLILSLSACQPAVQHWRVYVTNEQTGTLSVIEAPANRVIATILLGKRPRGAFLTRDGRTLFVALSGSPIAPPGVDVATLPPTDKRADGIGVIDTASLKLVRTLRGVSDPERVVGTPDGKHLYVASEDAGLLVEIDSASGARRALSVGDQPEGVAIAPDGATVYVGAEGDNRITAVDVRTFKTIGSVTVHGRPRTIVIAADGRGYVAAEEAGALASFDPKMQARGASVHLPGTGMRPMGVAVIGKNAFVTTGRGGALARVDTVRMQRSGEVSVGKRPWGIALSPDARYVYTANGPGNDVTVVDATSMKIVGRVTTGGGPWDVVAGPIPSSVVQR